MKFGPVVRKWWQDYVAGRLARNIHAAAVADQAIGVSPDRFFPGDLPIEVERWAAPERLAVQPAFFTTEGHLRQHERADWAHVDPRLMYWAALFIEYARKRSIPLYVHCALRGAAEQERLVAEGHSKAPYPRSAHNIGEAVDIVHARFHWSMTDKEWALLGVLGRLALDRVNAQLPKARKLALNWGGYDGPQDRFAWDPAHWEIADYRQRVRELPPAEPRHMTPRHILARLPLAGVPKPLAASKQG